MNPWKGLKNIPRSVWLISFATLINRSGSMVLPYLVLYLTKELKISASLSGVVLATYGAGAFITAPFVGKLSDRIGSLRVMKISLFATGIILFLYSFVERCYFVIGVTLVWSFINEAFRPANLSLISMETQPE